MQEQCECELIGVLDEEEGLVGELTNPIEYVYPELENIEITPTIEEQHFKSEKYGYNEVLVHKVEGEDIQIKPSLEEQKFNGLYENIIVDPIESEELNIVPNTEEQVREGMFNKITVAGEPNLLPENIKEGTSIFGVEGTGKVLNIKITDASYLFYNGARTEHIDELLSLCEEITSAERMFNSCSKLTELDVSKLDTSNVTNMSYMFNLCSKLTELNLSNFNTSNVTTMYRMFGSMNISKIDLSNFNTSKCTNMSQMFYASDFTEINLSSFDTSKVTNMSEMFYNCNITDLRLLDTSSINSIGGMFSYCAKLVNLGGFFNLGKGYTQKSNNYSSYKLNLSSCSQLTHESLMNVINNLYDLNLTYDVANGGTLYTQTLQLGSTNLAKLTAEEIAIATSKGWNVT